MCTPSTAFTIIVALDHYCDLVFITLPFSIISRRCTAFFAINHNNFFCGEDPLYQSNICNQDIGGGFVVSFNGVDTLIGVSALVIEACAGTWPSAYTRIQPYREWIRSVTSV